MTPEQWLSEQIRSRGITQVFISRKTGIDPNKICFSLNGRRKFKVQEFLAVCSVVGVNPLDWLGCQSPHAMKGESDA